MLRLNPREERDEKPMTQGPKRVVSVLLSLIVLSAGFLDYWSYSREFYKNPGIWMDVVSGTAEAPNQYRIGVIDAAYFLARHTRLGLRHTLTAVDVVAGFIAVFALFLVLRRSVVYSEAPGERQWIGAAGFVILVQFYLAWLLWYQRPETLPTAALLALALVLLAVKLPLPKPWATIVPVVGLISLAVVQGFVRADVAFALHVGILLVCLTPAGTGFALSRTVQAATSLVAAVVAVGVQYDLMKRVYPQANYGGTPVFQLILNLKAPVGYLPFLIFLVPLGWTAVMLARRRYQTEAASIGMFTAAVIFLGMWVTVGRIREVRVFMPFALALTPLTVEIAMQRFLPAAVEFEAPSGVDG
jgi:hypothetical protein